MNNKLEEPAHRLTIGLDLLAEIIFEIGNARQVSETLQARAWFLAQALKRDAAEIFAVSQVRETA